MSIIDAINFYVRLRPVPVLRSAFPLFQTLYPVSFLCYYGATQLKEVMF